MSCVVCESYAVQLRPAVDVHGTKSTWITGLNWTAYDSHITHDMLPQHQINVFFDR